MNNDEIRFPNYFADAETDYHKAKYVIYGIPFDKTSSFRFGSSKGPDVIRQSSWNFESYNMLNHIDFSDIPVHDYGNINSIDTQTSEQMIQIVARQVKSFLNDNKIPIGIGGEHSISAGILQSFPKDIHVIIFDAHMDFRDSYENETYNHACAIKRISDTIPIENIHIIGVRSAEKQEYQEAIKKNLDFYDMNYIQANGLQGILQSLKDKIQNKKVYVSIDIDVIDPGFAPGTGTPEPFGLHPKDILLFFDSFAQSIIGFDIMEVNPLFDHGQTAALAAKYVRYGIETIHAKKDK